MVSNEKAAGLTVLDPLADGGTPPRMESEPEPQAVRYRVAQTQNEMVCRRFFMRTA